MNLSQMSILKEKRTSEDPESPAVTYTKELKMLSDISIVDSNIFQ